MSQSPSTDNNPKTAEGKKKPQIHLTPVIGIQAETLAFQDGAEKYGPYNWRDKAVSVSTYVSAMQRHIHEYWEGEDIVPDSKAKAHHLGAIRACCNVLLDAEKHGKLIDDRPTKNERCTCANPQLSGGYCMECDKKA